MLHHPFYLFESSEHFKNHAARRVSGLGNDVIHENAKYNSQEELGRFQFDVNMYLGNPPI